MLQEETSTKDKDHDKDHDKEKEKDNDEKEFCSGGQGSRTLEERRRSMLDHHWAVPSKDRTFSVDDEQQDSLNSDKVIIYLCHGRTKSVRNRASNREEINETDNVI